MSASQTDHGSLSNPDRLVDMSSDLPRVVIVGGGHAGGTAAAMLREMGWRHGITIVCEEEELPYQRPPLSKAWLKGEIVADGLVLRPASFYADHDIDICRRKRAVAVDPNERCVVLEGGDRIAYSHLIVATGASPLSVPSFVGYRNVTTLRTMDDAETLRTTLNRGGTLAVVGGGFVGLEVAATARQRGMDVIVVERETQLMARVVGPELAQHVTDKLRTDGVRIVLDRTADSLSGDDGRATELTLSDGCRFAVDAVLVGIGARPNDSILREAGVACDRGAIVDEFARTSIEEIYAIGDCTNRPLPLYGRRGNLESVPSAVEQARQAASSICGRPAPKAEVPWFWSDQGDLRIQIAGLRHDVVEKIVRGDLAAGKFAVFHLGQGNVVRCVEAVNSVQEFMMGKKLIAQSSTISREKLRDTTVPIRDVAA